MKTVFRGSCNRILAREDNTGKVLLSWRHRGKRVVKQCEDVSEAFNTVRATFPTANINKVR